MPQLRKIFRMRIFLQFMKNRSNFLYKNAIFYKYVNHLFFSFLYCEGVDPLIFLNIFVK